MSDLLRHALARRTGKAVPEGARVTVQQRIITSYAGEMDEMTESDIEVEAHWEDPAEGPTRAYHAYRDVEEYTADLVAAGPKPVAWAIYREDGTLGLVETSEAAALTWQPPYVVVPLGALAPTPDSTRRTT